MEKETTIDQIRYKTKSNSTIELIRDDGCTVVCKILECDNPRLIGVHSVWLKSELTLIENN